MLILGADELQIRPNGWWLVYFIPNKRIGNAYTLAGRIANSPERGKRIGNAYARCGRIANSPERGLLLMVILIRERGIRHS